MERFPTLFVVVCLSLLLAAGGVRAMPPSDGFLLVRGGEFLIGDVATSKGDRVRLDDLKWIIRSPRRVRCLRSRYGFRRAAAGRRRIRPAWRRCRFS